MFSFVDEARVGHVQLQHVLVDITDHFSITYDDGRQHEYSSLSELVLNCRRLTFLLSEGVKYPKEDVFHGVVVQNDGYPEPLV